jgi:hypothetical protein
MSVRIASEQIGMCCGNALASDECGSLEIECQQCVRSARCYKIAPIVQGRPDLLGDTQRYRSGIKANP